MRILFFSDFPFAADDKWIWDFLPETGHQVEFVALNSDDRYAISKSSPLRIIGPLLRAREVVRSVSTKRYDIVVAWENKNGLPLAFWKRLYQKREMPLIILTFSPKPYSKIWLPLLRSSLTCVNHLTVPSNSESLQCQIIFDIHPDRISSCRLGTYDLRKLVRIENTTSDHMSGAYIFTGGSTDRDYLTFSKAVYSLSFGIVVNAPQNRLRGIELPQQTKVNGIMPRRQYFELLSHSKIVVVPLKNSNYAAGLSVILHAFSAGKPVVCTDTPVAREYVDHQETGILVKAGDARAMRDAINQLISDPALRIKMGRLARSKFEQEFTFSAFAKRTNKILHDFQLNASQG